MNRKELDRLFRIEYETNPRTGKPRKTARYVGSMYATDTARLKKARLHGLLQWLTALAFFLAGGLRWCRAQTCPYVAVFYALTILALFRLALALIAAWRLPECFNALQKEESLGHGTGAAVMLTVFGALWAVAAIIYTWISRSSVNIPGELFFALCGAADAIAGFLCYREWKQLPVRESPHQEKEEP